MIHTHKIKIYLNGEHELSLEVEINQKRETWGDGAYAEEINFTDEILAYPIDRSLKKRYGNILPLLELIDPNAEELILIEVTKLHRQLEDEKYEYEPLDG